MTAREDAKGGEGRGENKFDGGGWEQCKTMRRARTGEEVRREVRIVGDGFICPAGRKLDAVLERLC